MTPHRPMLLQVLVSVAGLTSAALLGGCGIEGSPLAAPASSAPARTDAASEYADGEYTAIGVYGGQPSSIIVEVTLEDGIITAVEVTPTATIQTSRDFQERFAAAVPDEVVGRPIDEVELDYLAGSSGTTQGFNDALTKVRAQAAP